MAFKTDRPLVNHISTLSTLKMLFFLILLCFNTCRSKPDFKVMRSEILEIHKKTINAHWQKDVDHFIKNMAKDYLFVQNGEIQQPQKDEITAKMRDYLNNTTFTEYRDLQEPIIGFSKDGSVAWSIVQVKVAGKCKKDDGTARDLDFICAWITLYEQQGNNWIRLAEVSNFK